MKLFVLLILSLLGATTHAFYQDDETNYSIFEPADQIEAQEFMKFMGAVYGVKFNVLPKTPETQSIWDEINAIKEELHHAFLAYYDVSEEDYPMPYVVLDQGQISATFSMQVGGKLYSTNFISISINHATNEDSMYSILAHEMGHYYHKHGVKQTPYISAGYTDHRVLDHANGFGEKIPNLPGLTDKLRAVLNQARTFEGGYAKVSVLKTVRIGRTDPVLMTLLGSLKEMGTTSDMKCFAWKAKFNLILKSGKLSDADVEAMDELSKECSVTKDKTLTDLYKKMLPAELLVILEDLPNKEHEMGEKNLQTAALVTSIMKDEHPVSTGLRLIQAYRTELKQLVSSIDWDRLQFYSPEDEADITAFKVLNEIGKAHYQLSMLEFAFDKNKCVETINDAEKEVAYYGAIELDTHHSSCWRLYRTVEMLKAYTKEKSILLTLN